MKILVVGAGGVGGFYGGRLAHSGCDVTFVARGAHLEAMRAHGLVIENRTQGDIRLPQVKVTDDPASVVRVQPGSRWRIKDCQPGVQGRVAQMVGLLLQPPAQVGVGRRAVEESPEKGLQV